MSDQTMNGIDIAFSRKKTMDTESFLNGDETYEQLLIVVQKSTGEDFGNLIPLYNNSDAKGKTILYDSMINHYLATVEFAKKDTELAIDFAIDTYSKFWGITKEKYKKKLEASASNRQFKAIKWLLALFYLMYNLTFIIALFLFAISN